NGGIASGGAIVNGLAGASATISHCTFIGNETHGGDGGVQSPTGNLNPGNSQGGAISGGTPNFLYDSTFIANRGIGGNGATATSGVTTPYGIDGAVGGAIQFEPTDGMLLMNGCTFTYNQAIAGSNGTGGSEGPGLIGNALGGALHVNFGATAVLTN